MEKIRVGVIGAGGIAGRWHLPELAGIPDVDIAVIAGRKSSRLNFLARQFNCRTTTDYQALVDASDVDAILIATPHPLHVEWALRAIRAGKHVMVQKPLCGELSEADRFAEVAATAHTVVFCLPHFGADVLAVRALVRAGRIGRVSGAYARTSHGGPELYYASIRNMFCETGDDLWFFDASRASVGALFDMGIYSVSRLIAVLGSVTEVYGRVATLTKPTALEDSASLILEFAGGCTAVAETSWCDPAWTWTMTLHGAAAKIDATGLNDPQVNLLTPTCTTREDAPVEVASIDLAEHDIGNAHQTWIDCIRSGEKPLLSNWQMARHVTEVLLAGLQSSRERRPIEVRSRL